MKNLINVTLCILAFLFVITGCSGSLSSMLPSSGGGSGSDASSIVPVLFHQPYIDASGIGVHHEKRTGKDAWSDRIPLAETPVVVKHERGGLLSSDYYAVTSSQGSYYYYGSVKDNRPEGTGVLTSGLVDLNDPSKIGHLIYAGDFKKGTYHGYGVLFDSADADSIAYISKLVDDGAIDGKYESMLALYLTSYVSYDGDFKNGLQTGNGNFFEFSDIVLSQSPPQEGYWGERAYPVIKVAEVKKGELDGDIRYYEGGTLIYEGDAKGEYRHGKGTLYYPNGQKQYEGGWKRDKYDGQGTLYDENGKVIYEGKWSNGDYAS